MKFSLCFFSAALLLIHTVFSSNLEISGTYKQSENWNVDTLNITGDVAIVLPDTESIIIKPGTVALFHGIVTVRER